MDASSPFSTAVNQRLDELARLKPNWDREGARRIDPQIIRATRDLVWRLPDHITAIPCVVPTFNGTLQLEWHDGPRTLELEIETLTTIHYLKWDEHEGIEEEDTFYIHDILLADSLICWFTRSQATVIFPAAWRAGDTIIACGRGIISQGI